MLFKELRELNKLVFCYNVSGVSEAAVFWHPHMFKDGYWAVTINFGHIPMLSKMWPILEYCEVHSLLAFWGEMNGSVALFLQ